jgi:hypothetical protein
MPIHAAVGAAKHDRGQVVYHDTNFFGGLTLSSYRLG